MVDERLFSLDLLDSPASRKLEYYKNYTMGHPNLDAAFERIKPIIRECGDSRVLFVIGPTGTGKTKLIELIQKWTVEELMPELKIDRGRIPFANVEVTLPESGLFNPKDHLKRCLHALNEPEELIDHKINYGVQGVYRDEDGELVIRPSILESELGWALERALKYRRPKIFVLDEAHHILSVASGRKLVNVPEAIKSLANRTRVLHGLVGSYQLLALHDIGEQLSRRSIYIHLPRYDVDYIEDRDIWSAVLWNFQHSLPLPEMPDLLGQREYLYQRSLGCVGTLKNWTYCALADALAEGSRTLTREHLEKRALSEGQCANILRNIKEGEKLYRDIEGQKQQLIDELWFSREPISRNQAPPRPAASPTDKATTPAKPKKNVGHRKPQRDPVGGQSNAG